MLLPDRMTYCSYSSTELEVSHLPINKWINKRTLKEFCMFIAEMFLYSVGRTKRLRQKTQLTRFRLVNLGKHFIVVVTISCRGR